MKKIILVLLLVVPLLILGGFWFAASSLIAPVNQTVIDCPTELKCENTEFASESGANIKGWLVRGEPGKGAVILMHGVRGNRAAMLERMQFLNKSGYGVLAFDFQASGESIGKQVTFGYLESRDAEASIKYLHEKMPDEKIGVIGISMGGAAFLLQPNPQKVDALVLEMVYPSMRTAIDNRLNMWLFSGADNFSPLLTAQFPLRLGISADEMRPLTKISEFEIPLLEIAAENDRHTTLAESRQLFEAANEPKQLWIVPNAEHQDLYKLTPESYQEKITNFFEKTLRQ